MRLPKTLNVQVGRKFVMKTKDEILKEVVKVFKTFHVVAVQLLYDCIRVTFKTVEGLEAAKRLDGVHLFGIWCRILGGGPPLTMVHVFDYPFEESDSVVSNAFGDFGEVKKVKIQSSIGEPEIFTGTRLVSMVLRTNPPRSLLLGGYLCRVWYKGQPLVCNLCSVQGHKSANCPNKDRCRLCGKNGHFARQCRDAWNGGARVEASVANQEGSGAPNLGDLGSREGGPAEEDSLAHALSVDNDSLVNALSLAGDEFADDDDFHDASEGSVIEEVLDESTSPDGPLSSQEISEFSSQSQSILPRNVSNDCVGDQGSLERETNVSDSRVVVSSQSSARSGPNERVVNGGRGNVRSRTGGRQAAGGRSSARSRSNSSVVEDGSRVADGGQSSVPSKTSGRQAAGGQSGARSKSSDRAADDGQMDTSVCRKRKDRPDLGRSYSVDDLPGRAGKKAFKTPVVPPGRHGCLPAAVGQRPSALPVRVPVPAVRVRDRPQRT